MLCTFIENDFFTTHTRKANAHGIMAYCASWGHGVYWEHGVSWNNEVYWGHIGSIGQVGFVEI